MDLIRQVEFILQRESKGLQSMGDLLVYLSQITLAQISRTIFIRRRWLGRQSKTKGSSTAVIVARFVQTKLLCAGTQ